jgi:hypothetical protein
MMLQALHFIINKFTAALVKPLQHLEKRVTHNSYEDCGTLRHPPALCCERAAKGRI